MKGITYVFMHGWGTSGRYWDNLLPFYQNKNYIVWDRGYYGKRKLEIQKDTHYVGIGHSLGCIHLLKSELCCEYYVFLQGFMYFLEGSDERKREIDILGEHLRKNTEATVRYFCKKHSFPVERGEIDSDIIHKDFNLLYEDHTALFANKKYRVLASENDTVVPIESIQKEFEEENISIHTKGGHALGYREADCVFRLIEEYLSPFI